MSENEYQDKVFMPYAKEIPYLQEFLRTIKDIEDTEIDLEAIDYFSLCFGFMLAKEIGPNRAFDLACYVRYELELA